MGIVTKAIVSLAYGLQANLPTTAAAIATALNISVSNVIPGIGFFCTDTGNLYVWNGTEQVQINASQITLAWGNITGTLSNQTDLQAALNLLAPLTSLPVFQVSGTPTSSQSTINYVGGTDITVSNPSSGEVEITFSGQLANTFGVQSNQFLVSYNATTGNFTSAQPSFSNISGTATNGQLQNSTITIDGDGTIFSNTAPGTISLGGSGSLSLISQSQNLGLFSPNGSSGTPSFRAMLTADMPTSGTWSFSGTFSGNYTATGNGTITGTETHANSTAATLDVNVSSPTLVIAGNYYGAAGGTLAASNADGWTFQNLLANGSQNSGSAIITNISESSGSVVTLTLASPTSAPAAGQTWVITGLSAGTWLNGYAVTLITGNATTCTFNDPTAHGTLTSTALTGTPVMTRVDSLSTLALSHSGSVGIPTITVNNTNAATSSLAQSSPILTIGGQYWNGSVSAADTWTVQDVIGNGTNPTSVFTFSHSGTTGTAAISFGNIPRIGTNNIWLCTSANVNGVTTAQAINIQASGWGVALSGNTGTGNGVTIGNQLNYTATSGTQNGVLIGGDTGTGTCRNTFAPTSGSANFQALQVSPTINQTGSASGSYTGILVNIIETALLGSTNKLLDLQSGTTGGTSRFSVDNTGLISLPNSANTATSATAGSNGAVPSQVVGYIVVKVNGTNVKVPYFAT